MNPEQLNILTVYHHGAWHHCELFHEKFFKAHGHKVFAADLEKTPYWTNFYDRLPFYVPKGWPVTVKDVEKARHQKFDIVVEIDGVGQYHIPGARERKAFSVLWSMDTHVPAKQRFQVKNQEHYDLIYTCHKDYRDVFKGRECLWLPVAADPDYHRPLDIPREYDIVFVGNNDPKVYPERARLLQVLSKKYKVKDFGKTYGQDMIKALNSGKIVFNRSLKGDLNMRVFEAMACGRFLITDRIGNGLTDLFEDGKHLAMYSDQDELEKKVEFYLTHDEEREKIARAGRKEVLEKHTYTHRAGTVLKDVMERMGGTPR